MSAHRSWRRAIARHGYNWVAIGAYNAGSPEKRKTYARKVFAMQSEYCVSAVLALADSQGAVN